MADDLQYLLHETDNGWQWELRAHDDRVIASGHATDMVQARAAAMLRGVGVIADAASSPGEAAEQ